MKAVICHELGEAEIEDVPRPKPSTGEVQIRIDRVQLSVTECRMFKGEQISYYDDIIKRIENGEGRVFGHEFCGVVTEVGENVSELSEGDRVYAPGKLACGNCGYCTSGYTHLCRNKKLIGYHTPGALAEYTCLPAGPLCRVPEGVPDSEAAALQPLASALLTVYEANIQPGDVVAVIGTGVMGYNVGQVAKNFGAGEVYAIDMVPKKLTSAENQGMIPINTVEEDPRERISNATDGIGADIIFEAVGGQQDHMSDGTGTLTDAYNFARRGGKIVQIGNISGDVSVRSGDLRKKSLDWIHPTLGVRSTGPNADTGQIAAQLVANGDISLSEYITHELKGLTSVEKAIEITLDRETGLGPAQIVL